MLAENSFNRFCSKAFFGNRSSGCCQSLGNKDKPIFQAKSLSAIMNEIQSETSAAENKLQNLLTQLGAGVHAGNLKALVRRNCFLMKCSDQLSIPQVERGKVCLDFESREPGGSFSAPEAVLKSYVLLSARHVTAASGAPHPVHGASGMAGVGNSIALIALGHDGGIRAHFIDGVLYMAIGVTATVGDVAKELEKIMRFTGATTNAGKVQLSTSLADVVSIAAIWFQGKQILFLIDDIWPNAAGPLGYLTELEGLLQGIQESRIAISTRSLQIAAKVGSQVDFAARDPSGPTSVAMLTAHAAPAQPLSKGDLEAAQGILDLCAGLPFALSIVVEAVFLRVSAGFTFEYACQGVSGEMYPGTSFLDAAIGVSLSSLEGELGKSRTLISRTREGSYTDAILDSDCLLLPNIRKNHEMENRSAVAWRETGGVLMY